MAAVLCRRSGRDSYQEVQASGGLAIKPPATLWRNGTWLAILLHFAAVLWLGLSHHWSYLSSLNDLGAFDQAIWNTLHNDFMRSTVVFSQPVNWLGFHFNPVLLGFVPLYALAPRPEWLILAQALALSLSAWPIFLLARHVHGSGQAAFFWALAYLLNPFLWSAAAWDFHPVSLAVPFMALGMLAVTTGNQRLLFLSCIPLLLIQEHFGLSVAGFGLLWWIRRRSWKTGLLWVMIGLAHLLLVLGLLMPALSPTGEHVMLGGGQGQLSRYAWLGNTFGEVMLTLMSEPINVLRKIFVEMGGGLYLGLLVAPFLLLPLAEVTLLLPGVADLAANLLSANPMPRNIFGYHSASLVPVFAAAAIHGLNRLSKRLKRLAVQHVAMLVLVASALAGLLHAPFPVPRAINVWMPANYVNRPDTGLEEIRSHLGSGDSLSVQGNLGAHFSGRAEAYLFPAKLGEANKIVLRLDSPTQRLIPQEPGMLFTLAHHLQMHPADYLAKVDCLLESQRYGVVLWHKPWLVLKSGAKSSNPAWCEEIRQHLDLLAQHWNVSGYSAKPTAICAGI